MTSLAPHTGAPGTAPGSGRPLVDPATGACFGHLPDTTAHGCAEAVQDAAGAFAAWSGAGPHARGEALQRLADAVASRRADFVEAERRCAGKPVARIGGEVDFAVRVLRWFAHAAVAPWGEVHPAGPGARSYTDRLPLGVCVAICPSNYPLLMAVWKAAGALAYGNTVVLKPSPETPLSVRLLVELAGQVLPRRVLGAVYGGAQVGRVLCGLPQVAAVSFTGSTAAGREVARRCAAGLKRVSLELGGKNPLLVFADADLEAAAAAAVEAFAGNSGQVCVGASRLLVHQSVHGAFVRRVAEQAAALRLGPTQDPDTGLGPLVTAAAVRRVQSAVREAVALGATALPPGGTPVALPGACAGGFYVRPVVLDQVPVTARAWREELFGPVLSVRSFSSDEQALQLAADTDYGLSASVWTADAARIERLGRDLRCGMLWFNSWGDTDESVSVGGIGNSGYGRELGVHAVDQYTHTRAVWVTGGPR